MVDFFIELNPIYQALLACTFTFLVTALGAALVFLVKKVNQNLMDILLSISAGIMLSSSIFSLIIPALDSSDDIGCNASILLSIGIMVGALLIYFCDYLYNKKEKKIKKIKRNKKKNNVNNLKWAGMSDANTVISNNRHTITNNVPDTIASNTIINGKSNNTKLYFMVYVNNTGKDQTEQDKDGFSGIITVTATSDI